MHHKHFFTDQDPDFLRKWGIDWSFPVPLKKFVRILLKGLMALNLMVIIQGKRAPIPNLNFSLHVYHHLYPVVAFGNLPKIHAIYKREGLVDETDIFRSYGACLS